MGLFFEGPRFRHRCWEETRGRCDDLASAVRSKSTMRSAGRED